jgi:hypothetical protein
VVEHVGDRRVEQDLAEPRVVPEHRLELGPGGRRAEPSVAWPAPQAAAELVEHLLVGPVALDVGR